MNDIFGKLIMKKILFVLLAIASISAFSNENTEVNEMIQEKLLEIQKQEKLLRNKIKELSFILKQKKHHVSSLLNGKLGRGSKYLSVYNTIDRSINKVLTPVNDRYDPIANSIVKINMALGLETANVSDTVMGFVKYSESCENIFNQQKIELEEKIIEMCSLYGRSCQSDLSKIIYTNYEGQEKLRTSSSRKRTHKACASRASLNF